MPPEEESRPLAALDLGSNSFHLIVARELEGQLQIIDRHRERVGLGAGLDAESTLTEEAQERALASLERFAQRIWDIAPARLRVVATNTLRIATNAAEFLQRAEATLGAPIEIISGQEEARLTWLGVMGDLPTIKSRRLLVDIGGGSTECVLGDAEGIRMSDSLQLGCVSMSQKIFDDGKLTKQRFKRARRLAEVELQTISESYRALGWAEAYGSSGTIDAIAKYLSDKFKCGNEITLAALEALETRMCELGTCQSLEEEDGVRADRTRVIPGGLAVLIGVFEALKIESMRASQSALREGVLHDLLGRIHHHDVRQRSIHGLMWRFHVDMGQSHRVHKAALALFDSATQKPFADVERKRALLQWAAQTHEIGLTLAYSGYHKHSAYLALHSELDGFSREDQKALAFVLVNHRRRIRGDNDIVQISKSNAEGLMPLVLILRLAVLLMRSRHDEPLSGHVITKLTAKELSLTLPAGWLEAHPLAALDLEAEAQRFAEAGLSFEFSEIS